MKSLLDDPLLAAVPAIQGYRTLGLVALFAEIGRGGMGAVYRGRHLNLDVDVAVKCLLDQSGQSELISRFRREAMLVAKIRSPHLVQVMDVRNEFGLHYIVMEFVAGETLERRTHRRGPLAANEAVAIALDATRGLAAAHAKGVIHRDVKPGNVLISTEGEVKLTDLGIAKGDSGDSMMTLTTAVMGTPLYMPPEQFESAASVTTASDVYSMGATLAFMLLGKHAISGRTLPEITRQVTVHGFPDLDALRKGLPPEVVALVRRATAMDPLQRFKDAPELAAALQELLTKLGGPPNLIDDTAQTANAPSTNSPSSTVMAEIRRAVTTRSSPNLGAGEVAPDATMATIVRPAAVAPGAVAETNPSAQAAAIPATIHAAGATPARPRRRAGAVLLFVFVVLAGGAGVWWGLHQPAPSPVAPTPDKHAPAPVEPDGKGDQRKPKPATDAEQNTEAQQPAIQGPDAALADKSKGVESPPAKVETPTQEVKQEPGTTKETSSAPATVDADKVAAEAKAAAEKKAAEEKAAEEARIAAEKKAAEETRVAAEQKAAEKASTPPDPSPPAAAKPTAAELLATASTAARDHAKANEWSAALASLADGLATVTDDAARAAFRTVADEVLTQLAARVPENLATEASERASKIAGWAATMPRLAENGSAMAALLLVESHVHYEAATDHAVSEDVRQCLRWARMAADAGLPRGCFYAGEFLRQPEGAQVAKDEGQDQWQLVHDYYNRAATAGEADSMARMAGIYFSKRMSKSPVLWQPKGVANLDAWAADLARKSARAGSARGRFLYSQFLLAATQDTEFSSRSGLSETGEQTSYPLQLEEAARLGYRPAIDELLRKQQFTWASQALTRLRREGVLTDR